MQSHRVTRRKIKEGGCSLCPALLIDCLSGSVDNEVRSDLMRIAFLTTSLLVLLVSMVVSNVTLFAIGMVSFIVALVANGSCSRLLLLLFWIWMNLVLVYLCSQPVVTEEPNPDTVYLLLGLPVSAFWMLFGIWIFPVFLWPLGFALTHKQWMRR